MARVYIATRIEQMGLAQSLADIFKAAGHTITCEWFDPKLRDERGWLKDMSHEGLKKMASEECSGVIDCDFFVMIHEGGRGTHFEFGIAYAMNKHIAIYDPMEKYHTSTTTFHHLDFPVFRFSAEIVEWMRDNDAERRIKKSHKRLA